MPDPPPALRATPASGGHRFTPGVYPEPQAKGLTLHAQEYALKKFKLTLEHG
jgi:hypothetical protein